MRRVRLALPSFLFLAFASTALASPQYQHLRARNPAIDRAIAAMPSSSVHGDFARVSALLAQPQVQAFLATAPAGQAPSSSIERRLGSALENLASSLEWGLDSLSMKDALVIGQLVTILAVEPALDVQNGSLVLGPCGGSEHPACPPIEEGLARLVPVVEAAIRADYAELRASDPSLPASLPAPDPVPPGALAAWIDDVLELPCVA